MPPLPRYETAYSTYVSSNLSRMLLERGGAYNYVELAEMVGLKPTQHFKRRVRQLVSTGALTCFSAFTPRGGLENRFGLPQAEPEVQIPF